MREPWRRVVRSAHLWLGLGAALILLMLGASGAVLAFAPDYDRWAGRDVWRVAKRGNVMRESLLTDLVTQAYGPARVISIAMPDPAMAHLFTLSTRKQIFVDPYRGTILGVRARQPAYMRYVSLAQQVHVRLAAGVTGRWLVDLASLAATALVFSGIALWWKKKRFGVHARGSWARIAWDTHSTAGILAGAFVLFSAVTGVMMAFDSPFYWLTASPPQPVGARPQSPSEAGEDAALDAIMAAADRALPEGKTVLVEFPMAAHSAFAIRKEFEGWRTRLRSTVYVDRHDAVILRVDDARAFTAAYRARAWVAGAHTGTAFGPSYRAVLMLASIFLVVLTGTGIAIASKKAATAWAARAKSHYERTL